MLDDIVTKIGSLRLRSATEAAMQDHIATVLPEGFHREFRLNDKDRIDFLAGDVGIECKIDGTQARLMMQCERYLQSPHLASLIVVIGKARLGIGFPSEVRVQGVVKQVRVISTWKNAFL